MTRHQRRRVYGRVQVVGTLEGQRVALRASGDGRSIWQASQESTMPVPRCGLGRGVIFSPRAEVAILTNYGDSNLCWQNTPRVSHWLMASRSASTACKGNFEPMRRQVETRRAQPLTNATAKRIICRAFIEDELDAPKHIARRVRELYFAAG